MNQRKLAGDQTLTLQNFWKTFLHPTKDQFCTMEDKYFTESRIWPYKKQAVIYDEKRKKKNEKKYCKFWMLVAMIMWAVNSQITESTVHFYIINCGCSSSGTFILLNKFKVFSTTEMQNMTLPSINLNDLAFSKGRFTKTNNNCKFPGSRDIAYSWKNPKLVHMNLFCEDRWKPCEGMKLNELHGSWPKSAIF